MLCIGFFFFKQKTAYEMRISDWSSDVCSSDLNGTMPSGLAGEECRRGMAATEDAEQLAQVFSAYLDVPEEAALGATCQALVRAIKAGDVSLDTLLLFTQPVTDSGELFEAGRLLRAIFLAHRLTTSASAEGETQP